MTRVAVQPELLSWALERAYKTPEDLAGRCPQLVKWLAGDVQPTFPQLQEFAKATATPFGYLFLPTPPEERLPIPDFRTVSERPLSRPSADLLDTLHMMQRRQDWLRETLSDEGHEPLHYVGSATLSDDPEKIAHQMRITVGLDEAWAAQLPRWQDALGELRRALEAIGILPVINSVVGNNTHRKLSVSEFRGFALVDPLAPLIFVNGSDAKSAQMFTLAHELAHIWIGRGGVSGYDGLLPGGSDVEVFCNKAAAEFLVPAKLLREIWSGTDNTSVFSAARYFKVSPVVAARRALDLHLMEREQFFAFYKAYQAKERREEPEKKSGGDFYNNQNYRVGERFAVEVIRAAREGRILYDHAYQLTGMQATTFNRYAKRLGFDML